VELPERLGAFLPGQSISATRRSRRDGMVPSQPRAPSQSGCILLALPSLKVLYLNREFIRILAYPEDPERLTSADRLVIDRMPFLLDFGSQSSCEHKVLSGRRHTAAVSFP
jgi:hypothetical protein